MIEGSADQLVLVDVLGTQRPINLGMLDEPVFPGDWVLIHMGFALESIDEDAARTALAGLELMGRRFAGGHISEPRAGDDFR